DPGRGLQRRENTTQGRARLLAQDALGSEVGESPTRLLDVPPGSLRERAHVGEGARQVIDGALSLTSTGGEHVSDVRGLVRGEAELGEGGRHDLSGPCDLQLTCCGEGQGAVQG